ncbi:MAG TPA: hypothetical protein VMV69_08285 [Pirellulales bacterium]|nr:hypothetical protein [Pirellulales bacterium]
MIVIQGRKSTEHGNAATGNLRKQVPHLLKYAPELAAINHGTINVELEKALVVARPDFRTDPITWQEQNKDEVFDILRIKFESKNEREPVDCWVYIAYQSAHRNNLWHHEIVGPRWLNIVDGEACCIHIDRDSVELPYQARKVVVI